MREFPAPNRRGDRHTLTVLTDPLTEGWLTGLGLSSSELHDLRRIYKNLASGRQAFMRRRAGLFATSYQLSKSEADRRLKLALSEELGGQHV
jgi:hypothetical protein